VGRFLTRNAIAVFSIANRRSPTTLSPGAIGGAFGGREASFGIDAASQRV
jgi:hypothetical protein